MMVFMRRRYRLEDRVMLVLSQLVYLSDSDGTCRIHLGCIRTADLCGRDWLTLNALAWMQPLTYHGGIRHERGEALHVSSIKF